MKKTWVQDYIRVGVSVLVIMLFLAVSAELSAQATVVVQGVSYNVAGSLKDNLKSLTGKDIFINLRSGKIYQGYVKSVGDHFVHVEKIAGKDFYDALIRIEDISAIEAKFRDMK